MIIDDGKQKSAPAVTPAAPAVSNEMVLALLAQLAEQSKISAARELRLQKLEEAEDARVKAKKDRYELNRKEENKGYLDVQKNCKHLKGGKYRKKNAVKDYGLGCHTFINGAMEIRCLVGCRMRWIPTDTREYIIRDGRKLRNHTGKSWADVVEMLDVDSSNTPTKSETSIPLTQEAINANALRLAEAAANTTDSGLVLTEE